MSRASRRRARPNGALRRRPRKSLPRSPAPLRERPRRRQRVWSRRPLRHRRRRSVPRRWHRRRRSLISFSSASRARSDAVGPRPLRQRRRAAQAARSPSPTRAVRARRRALSRRRRMVRATSHGLGPWARERRWEAGPSTSRAPLRAASAAPRERSSRCSNAERDRAAPELVRSADQASRSICVS